MQNKIEPALQSHPSAVLDQLKRLQAHKRYKAKLCSSHTNHGAEVMHTWSCPSYPRDRQRGRATCGSWLGIIGYQINIFL